MDESRLMGGDEATEDLLDYAQGSIRIQRCMHPHHLPERIAGHVVHSKPDQLVLSALVEHAHHVGVVELRRSACFSLKSGDEPGILGERLMHDFQRHHPVQAGVVGSIDSGHPSAGDDTGDPIAAVHQFPDDRVTRVRC